MQKLISIMAGVAIALVAALSIYLLALAGEPQSAWFVCDVMGFC